MLKRVQRTTQGISLYLSSSSVPIVIGWDVESSSRVLDSLVLTDQITPVERDRILAQIGIGQSLQRVGG